MGGHREKGKEKKGGASEREKGKGKALAVANTHDANVCSGKAKEIPGGDVAKPANPSFSDYLIAFDAVTMVPTRYPDRSVLAELGILEDVEAIFLNMGMAKFFTMEYPTYKIPTQEFFASLTVHHGHRSPTTPENLGHIEFQVGEKNHSVSFHDICVIYGFKEGLNSYFPRTKEAGKEAAEIWDMLGDGRYVAGGSKASMLRNPALRYAHRVLAHTIFARKSTGKIRANEMCLIIEGIKPMLKTFSDGKVIKGCENMNLGAVFALYLASIKKLAWTSKAESLVVSIGGIVTPLLEFCGVRLEDPLKRAPRIDALYLAQTGYLAGRVQKSYAYCLDKKTNVLLPNPAITSLSSRDSIIFKPRRDLFFHPCGNLQLDVITAKDTTATPLKPIQDTTSPFPLQIPIHGSARYYQQPFEAPLRNKAERQEQEDMVQDSDKPWKYNSVSSQNRSVGNLVKEPYSVTEVKKWARDDLTQTISWLESQEEKPEAAEIKRIAAEGVLTCLQDAIDSLEQKQDIASVMELWSFVPRVVKELGKIESSSSEKENSTASKKELCKQAKSWKEIYEVELAKPDKEDVKVMEQRPRVLQYRRKPKAKGA